MTAAQLLAAAEAAGLAIRAEDGILIIRGPSRPFDRYCPQLKGMKPQILALLNDRAREATELRLSDLGRARDIRERHWTQAKRPCGFFCGEPDAKCWRCGGTWLEHFEGVVHAGTGPA